MNLLKETIEELEKNGETLEDVLFTICDGRLVTAKLVKFLDVDYDDMWGVNEVNLSLMIVGEDWWLERHEYDGSEWWEFKRLPPKPLVVFDHKTPLWNDYL